jgi:hypothetical protein
MLGLVSALLAYAPVAAQLARTPSPAGAVVYLISPVDGAEVTSPFTVRFGLKGMGVGPAGLEAPNTGHHHLLIDAELPDLSIPIPADARHRHFGGGQTEVELELEPGSHVLRLLLGDRLHIPHDPPVYSDPVTVRVR